MSKFFINRPIVAIVIAILMVIVGGVTIVGLPVALFPQIAPPEVQITAVYTGADAQTVEQSVATPIEQQMSGVDNMNYMYSLNATAHGDLRLIVDFDIKTDPNIDLILAQSRETLAASQLPADVNAYGVTVQKTLTAPLMLISLNSPKSTYALGEAGSTGEARDHGSRYRERAPVSEHREPGWTSGQRACAKGPGVHVLSARAWPQDFSGGFRTNCDTGNTGRRNRAGEGCRPH